MLVEESRINYSKNSDMVGGAVGTLPTGWGSGGPLQVVAVGMLGAIGEFERDLINERTTEGIARAKANGVKFGPK